MAHDVFISHSHFNKTVADAVCAKLEVDGIRCWIAPRDVLPGNTYPSEIIRGIEDSKIIVFIFSISSNTSRAVHQELERAFSHGKIIIPFRIDDILPSQDVEFLIGSQHWLDAINPPITDRINELIQAVKRQLGAAGQSIPKPPLPARKLPRVAIFALIALVALLAAAGWGWNYWRKANANNLTQLLSPVDGETIVGSKDSHSIELSFSLPPDRLDEEAEIKIIPDGKPPLVLPPVSESYFLLPDGIEGNVTWCVRALWRDHPGADITRGPWSQKCSFTFYKDRLSKILITGNCVVGTADLTVGDKITNLDPSTGRPGGYEVDVLQAFFKMEAEKAGIKTPVVINHYGASNGWGDSYFHMLRDHTDVDLLASGITPTPQREKDWNVRFSEPSLKFPNVLLVRTGTKAVNNGEIIINHIGVADHTTNKDFILRYFASDPDRVVVAPLPKPYHTMSDWLFYGKIDGMLVDALYVPTIRTDYPELATGTDVVVLDPKVNGRFEYSSAAYALRPEDDELLDALNRFIVEYVDARKAISKHYFPDMDFLP